jgi:hypothetical protein
VEFTPENKKFQNFPNFFLGKTTNFVSDQSMFFHKCFFLGGKFGKALGKNCLFWCKLDYLPISSEKPAKI